MDIFFNSHAYYSSARREKFHPLRVQRCFHERDRFISGHINESYIDFDSTPRGFTFLFILRVTLSCFRLTGMPENPCA
jgi:hypothetical protein